MLKLCRITNYDLFFSFLEIMFMVAHRFRGDYITWPIVAKGLLAEQNWSTVQYIVSLPQSFVYDLIFFSYVCIIVDRRQALPWSFDQFWVVVMEKYLEYSREFVTRLFLASNCIIYQSQIILTWDHFLKDKVQRLRYELHEYQC